VGNKACLWCGRSVRCKWWRVQPQRQNVRNRWAELLSCSSLRGHVTSFSTPPSTHRSLLATSALDRLLDRSGHTRYPSFCPRISVYRSCSSTRSASSHVPCLCGELIESSRSHETTAMSSPSMPGNPFFDCLLLSLEIIDSRCGHKYQGLYYDALVPLPSHWWFSGKIGRCHSRSTISMSASPGFDSRPMHTFCFLLSTGSLVVRMFSG
jgi:hypothetical protein